MTCVHTPGTPISRLAHFAANHDLREYPLPPRRPAIPRFLPACAQLRPQQLLPPRLSRILEDAVFILGGRNSAVPESRKKSRDFSLP